MAAADQRQISYGVSKSKPLWQRCNRGEIVGATSAMPSPLVEIGLRYLKIQVQPRCTGCPCGYSSAFQRYIRAMLLELFNVNSINNLLKRFSSLSFGVIIALEMAYIRVLAVVASIFFRDAQSQERYFHCSKAIAKNIIQYIQQCNVRIFYR